MGLDFETYDRYISREMGGGWVYGINVPTSDFKVIGFSISTPANPSTLQYLPTMPYHNQMLFNALPKTDYVVMHNAAYDLGCLRWLGYDTEELKDRILDTCIIAKLYDNRLVGKGHSGGYSLDALSKRYLGKGKDTKALVDVVQKHNLAPHIKPENKTYLRELLKWSYSNMDIIQKKEPEAMAAYCNQDVSLTMELLSFFLKKVPIEQAQYYSDFARICNKIRGRGIKVSIPKLKQGMALLEPEIAKYKEKIIANLGHININSPKQLGEVLNTKTVNKAWMAQHMDNPAVEALVKYKEVNVLYNNFFKKILEMQQWTCPEALADGEFGYVYPELTPLGAATTGRFSSNCPNIQQIPKRNKEYGALMRSVFVPHNPEHEWISADWDNQEGRLQIHYASKVTKTANILVEAFKENPKLDLHQYVADLTTLERTAAKTINLGLSYGMGPAKLCAALGLPVAEKVITIDGKRKKIPIPGPEAQIILNKYYEKFPYLKELTVTASGLLKSRGFIKTLGDRMLYREHPRFDYKALNKLIQGSAADMMLAALKKADSLGLAILCIVHDEMNIEGTELDVLWLREHVMEPIYGDILALPMTSTISTGDSWGTLHEVT